MKALDLWIAILAGFGVTADKAKADLEGLAARFPDVASFTAAVEDYIATVAVPHLTTLPGVLKAQAVAWYEAGGSSPVQKNDSALM